MSVEKRKASSLMMKLIVLKTKSMFEDFSFSGDMEHFDWNIIRR